MDYATNPLTMVYDALWDVVGAHPLADELVRAGNRIRFDKTRDPTKDTVAAADLPEMVLMPTGKTPNMHSTSHTSMVACNYEWLLSTGDFRASHVLQQVEWMLIEAHVGWRTALTALRWPLESDWSFVKKCDIVNVREGLSDSQRNRGIRGWSAVWSYRVEMHFRSSDLKDAYDGT